MMNPVEEERVRFCDHCNAVTSWWSVHCEECGQRLAHPHGEGKRQKQPRVAGAGKRLEGPLGDLFRAHMRLLHRARAQADDLERRVARFETTLGKAMRRASRDAALAFSRQLVELEEDWERVQEAYNRQVEGLEEEQPPEIPHLHEDLLPELQSALETEFGGLSSELGTLAERLHRAGGEVDLMLARCSSRFFGLELGTSNGRAALVWIAVGLAVVGPGAAFAIGVAPLSVLVAAGPPLLALGFALAARDRG